MELHEALKNLLEKDGRFVSDGKLLKNKIVEFDLKLDKDLKNDKIKSEELM